MIVLLLSLKLSYGWYLTVYLSRSELLGVCVRAHVTCPCSRTASAAVPVLCSPTTRDVSPPSGPSSFFHSYGALHLTALCFQYLPLSPESNFNILSFSTLRKGKPTCSNSHYGLLGRSAQSVCVYSLSAPPECVLLRLRGVFISYSPLKHRPCWLLNIECMNKVMNEQVYDSSNACIC